MYILKALWSLILIACFAILSFVFVAALTRDGHTAVIAFWIGLFAGVLVHLIDHERARR